jgi:patatin-like phospholipase/acyl hydrolase
MKRVLQIDGGGLRGCIPATILDNFEKVKGKPCCEIFDLITGTSTGAIIGGVLASGVTSAETIHKMYVDQGAKLFTPKVPLIPFFGTLFTGAKYNRKPFIDLLKKYTGMKLMSELRTAFMATSFSLCSGRTHFIYSSDEYEKTYPVWEVISWSALSAAAYFGKINVPEFIWDDFLPDGTVKEDIKGAAFQDGGQGINNCTLGAATTMAIANKWFDEQVVILSLGCGDYHHTEDYNTASKTGWVGQVVDFMTQARSESMVTQYMGSRLISIKRKENYTLVRVNCSLPKKLDTLDGVKYIKEYENAGNQLKNTIPFDLF